MSFWRDDFVNKEKKQTFMIKSNQIKGLLESNKHKGITSGFVLNWRKTNHTYFWYIDDFIKCTSSLDKKSFNEADVIKNNGILINQQLKKVNYKYDIDGFISRIKGD